MNAFRNYIDYAFFSIYELIGNIQQGYPSETKMRRALLSIYTLALAIDLIAFGTFNNDQQKEYILPVWFVIAGLLYLIFGYKKRYLEMEKRYSNDNNRPLYGGPITIIFLVGSFLFGLLN